MCDDITTEDGFQEEKRKKMLQKMPRYHIILYIEIKVEVRMIKIAFCDDDLSVLEEIHQLYEKYGILHNRKMACGYFCSPFELLAEIEKGAHFDILFLDVIMPGEDGISVARQIRQYDSNVKIIFLTATSEYAVESYTVGAYFYQIKPVVKDSFFRLMDAVISECDRAGDSSLVMRCKSGVTKLDLEKLEYCEVIGRTLCFHLRDGTALESTGSLDELCAKLAVHENFLRVHRSFVINMEYIQNISYKAITMDSLAKIPIPHGKCSKIKNQYLEYAFQRQQVLL